MFYLYSSGTTQSVSRCEKVSAVLIVSCHDFFFINVIHSSSILRRNSFFTPLSWEFCVGSCSRGSDRDVASELLQFSVCLSRVRSSSARRKPTVALLSQRQVLPDDNNVLHLEMQLVLIDEKAEEKCRRLGRSRDGFERAVARLRTSSRRWPRGTRGRDAGGARRFARLCMCS